jgi:hypothetical protein
MSHSYSSNYMAGIAHNKGFEATIIGGVSPEFGLDVVGDRETFVLLPSAEALG